MERFCSTPRRVNLIRHRDNYNNNNYYTHNNNNSTKPASISLNIQRHMTRAFSREEKLKLLEKAKSPPGGYRPKLANAAKFEMEEKDMMVDNETESSSNKPHTKHANRKLLAAQ